MIGLPATTAEGGIEQPFALFEDNLSHPAHAILLDELDCCVVAGTPQELSAALEQIESARANSYWIALAADYELGALLESGALLNLKTSRPLLRAWIFKRKQCLTGQALKDWWQQSLASLSPQQAEAGLLRLAPNWSQTQHAHATQRILKYIHAGDCYQVNLTFPLHGQCFGHPLALFARLRETQTVEHGALIFDGQDWILSRSPELFVQRNGNKLSCRPMKGTALRSGDPNEDQASAQTLLHSDKDRAENLMIVDLIRNDLGRLSPPGGVQVDKLFELETYPSLFQLTSSVSAQPVRASFGETLQALFPCGSITGAPKIRAMQIIAELEETPRGLYCGALGWLAPSGDYKLNVPIRTLLLDRQGNSQLNVGSGIVADSDPAAEYQECLLKAGFLRTLQNDLALIETLLREADGSYPRLTGHMERLKRSAKALQIPCELPSIEQALQAFSQGLPQTRQRVRLQLDHLGQITLQNSELDAPPALAECRLAAWQLDAQDPRLAHKTTARKFYDKALQQAVQEGLFDLIFCNTKGELCEGARSNLFLEIEGKLLTPALECGLLPGVLRAELIASGKATERVLHLDDLKHANRIFLGNALRGLIEVRLRA